MVPVRDPTAGTLVAVELANPAFRDVFCELAGDLYRTLAPMQRGPGVPRALVDRLDKWQRFLRERQPKTIIFWGQRDLFFTPAGGEAYLADLPDINAGRP